MPRVDSRISLTFPMDLHGIVSCVCSRKPGPGFHLFSPDARYSSRVSSFWFPFLLVGCCTWPMQRLKHLLKPGAQGPLATTSRSASCPQSCPACRCFSVKTDLVQVQHHLSVSLRFGMGRSLKKQVPVHIHQMDAGYAADHPPLPLLSFPPHPLA